MKNIFYNTLKYILKILSKATIKKYKPKVIGITGNVGKTSTKKTLYTILKEKRNVRASPKSFNNEIGLPLAILGDYKKTGSLFFWVKVISFSIFQLIFKRSSYPEILILEYGIDKPGDMDRLLEIAKPRHGIVTAMGKVPSHIEFFPSRKALVREKTKMVKSLPATGFVVLNADDASVYGMSEKTRAKPITFGFEDDADMKITNFETVEDEKSTGISFKLSFGGSLAPVRIDDVVGKSQAYSAAAASALGSAMELNLVDISESFDHHEPPKGRLRVIDGIKGVRIIDDTYNSSPLSVEKAFEAVSQLEAKRKIAVLGDMLELGQHTLDAHKEVGKNAEEHFDKLITVGMRAKFIAEGAKEAGMNQEKINVFENIKEAGIFLQGKIQEDDLILIKASQAVRLEKVTKEIMENPEKANDLLVRQSESWLQKDGVYE
ncbi:MAG: UDP-N-acetylmuramoyl-tripeptide--D-alanyl-D-alanine ligase [Candidatus Magasanikbacteria bacterium]